MPPVDRLSIRVPGEPAAQARPKFVRQTGVAYKPKTEKAAATLIREEWRAAGSRVLEDGPYSMSLSAAWVRPDSHHKKDGTLAASGRAMPVPTYKDLDNIVKMILDSLQGLAIPDDRYLDEIRAVKSFVPKELGPHVSVTFQVSRSHLEERHGDQVK